MKQIKMGHDIQREIEIGDTIKALGISTTIGEILYQFDGGLNDLMCEFIDTDGCYHYWKQFYDGGEVISAL